MAKIVSSRIEYEYSKRRTPIGVSFFELMVGHAPTIKIIGGKSLVPNDSGIMRMVETLTLSNPRGSRGLMPNMPSKIKGKMKFEVGSNILLAKEPAVQHNIQCHGFEPKVKG